MYLLDEWESLESDPETPVYEQEYEVRARAHVTGVLELPCAVFRYWEIPAARDTNAPTAKNLLTRSRRLNALEPLPGPPPSAAQYYLPGGMAEEISVLLTLFTRVHFVVERTTRMDGMPFMQGLNSGGTIGESPRDGVTIPLGSLRARFESLRDLRRREGRGRDGVPRRRRLQPFMFAARLYHLAIGIKEHDEDLAYLNLVSAIEALLHDFEVELPPLADVASGLAKAIRTEVPDGPSRARLEAAAMERERLIGRKFRAFVLEYLPDRFWADDTRPRVPFARFKDASHLAECLSRIYSARSKALHEGAPFPPTSLGDMHPEVPPGLGMQIGSRYWGREEMLPCFRAFELVVHHVLNEYLNREAALGRVTEDA